MFDLVCGAIASKLRDTVKHSNVSVFYKKPEDKIIVKIKQKFYDREFQCGFVYVTELIHTGHSGADIAESVLRQYRRWVLNNFFQN